MTPEKVISPGIKTVRLYFNPHKAKELEQV